MIKQVVKLRFNQPEPPQVRANALSGIFKNGDEGNSLTFDDEKLILYVTKAGTQRLIPFAAVAWLECKDVEYKLLNDAPKK